jgi:hypothetical protein
MWFPALLMLHVLLTFVMGGVMWFVQICYYPNLAAVGRDAFTSYQMEHIRRVTRVAWTMLVLELITGLVLAAVPNESWKWGALGANAVCIVATWWSTWCVQVPLHHRLEQGWDESAHCRLVGTNWFRTALYTLRGLLLGALLWSALVGW